MKDRDLLAAVLYSVLLLLPVWAVFALQNSLNFEWAQLGVLPRSMDGLLGILTYPFIHADWKHLFNNTSALLVLLFLTFQSYRAIAFGGIFWIFLISGSWLWVIGRPERHIGASALVYGMFAFLFLSGILRRDTRLMAVSLIVIFLYGSLVWGIFPTDRNISWEGHLTGLLAGLIVAFYFRQQGPQRKVYEWDAEEAENDIDLEAAVDPDTEMRPE